MLTVLRYLKARYVDCHLNEKAQGMVEYALLVAFVVGIAAYLVYGGDGDGLGEKIEGTFDQAGDVLGDAQTQGRSGD